MGFHGDNLLRVPRNLRVFYNDREDNFKKTNLKCMYIMIVFKFIFIHMSGHLPFGQLSIHNVIIDSRGLFNKIKFAIRYNI